LEAFAAAVMSAGTTAPSSAAGPVSSNRALQRTLAFTEMPVVDFGAGRRYHHEQR